MLATFLHHYSTSASNHNESKRVRDGKRKKTNTRCYYKMKDGQRNRLYFLKNKDSSLFHFLDILRSLRKVGWQRVFKSSHGLCRRASTVRAKCWCQISACQLSLKDTREILKGVVRLFSSVVTLEWDCGIDPISQGRRHIIYPKWKLSCEGQVAHVMLNFHACITPHCKKWFVG